MGDLSIPARWGAVATHVASQQGWDAAQILIDAGISPRLLTGAPVEVSNEQIRTVGRAVASRTEDESFGMGGVAVPRGTAQMLLFSLATSGTLNGATNRWTAFREAVPFVPNFVVSTSGDLSTVTLDVSTLRTPDVTIIEWILGLLLRGTSWLTMREVPVMRVLLPGPRPARYPEYNKLFRAPVEFTSGTAALIIHSEHLDAPFLRTEDEITSILDRPDELIAGNHDYQQMLPERIRRVIRAGIGDHIPTVSEIAADLTMAPSVMQRILRTEYNTSVREIRDATLCDEAKKCLANEGRSLAELSARLGFSELSAFTRAFRRWTGLSPARYRAGARIGSND